MIIKDLEKLNEFEFLVQGDLNKEIKGCFIGDLLSWVMAKGQPGDAWVTVQAHLNVVAVALLREFACLIICDGAAIAEETIEKCKEEEFTLIKTELSAYEVSKVLSKLL